MITERLRHLSDRVEWLNGLLLLLTGITILQAETPVVVEPLISVLQYFPVVSNGRATQLPSLGLLLLVIYSLLPSLYPEWLGKPVKESPVVRALVAGLGFLFAQDLSLIIRPVTADAPGPIVPVAQTMPSLFGFVLVGFTLMALSYRTVQEPPLHSPNGIAIQSLLRVAPTENAQQEWEEELTTIRQHSDTWYRVSIFSVLLMIGILDFLPVIFLGLFVGVLSLFYPVLELLAVTRVLVSYLPSGTSVIQRLEIPDLEAEFYERLTHSRTFASWPIFLAIFTGIGISMTMFVSVSSVDTIDPVQWRYFGWAIAELFESPSASAIGYVLVKGVDVVSHTAFAVTPSLMAVYGVWFWMRVIRRVPALVRQHLDETKPAYDVSINATLSCRPRGYLLPLVPLSVVYAHYFTQPSRYLGLRLTGAAFLTLWLSSVLLVGTTVYWSRGTSAASSLCSVQREVFLPFLVIWMAAYLLFPDSLGIAYIGGMIVLYLLVNFLFYWYPTRTEKSSNLWWATIIAIVALTGVLPDIPLLISLGLGVVILGLWLVTRKVEEITE